MAEREYEAMTAAERAVWHMKQAQLIQTNARQRLLRARSADAAYVLAARHQRMARWILWQTITHSGARRPDDSNGV